MAIVHIPEEEARKDFGAVLSRLDEGDEIVIDRATGNVTLINSSPGRALTFAEAIDRLPKHSEGIIDEDFERDARSFRDRHVDGFDSSKWD